MNTSSIKIMLMAIVLLVFGGILQASSPGVLGSFGFLFGIAGLMLGIYGFRKED